MPILIKPITEYAHNYSSSCSCTCPVIDLAALLLLSLCVNRQALYHVDLALACVFALNWVFWFWVAEDRVKYVFSFLTLIDAITIIPAFALYGLGAIVNTNVPGLNFLRVLR